MLAGLKDLQRPADQLSIGQSASLAATGLIWSRYSLVIIPKNYSLFAGNFHSTKLLFLMLITHISYFLVNVFVALTQLTQLYRAFSHHQGLKNQTEAPAITEETKATKAQKN